VSKNGFAAPFDNGNPFVCYALYEQLQSMATVASREVSYAKSAFLGVAAAGLFVAGTFAAPPTIA
jgi:hypothetical protein